MATLKDVAREAGLSVGTVSRVLNNRGYISEETRQSVAAAMKRLNYQPNEMARSLSRRRSSMIGVIVPNISHPYFTKLIECLEDAAHREGYEILLFASRGKASREEEYVMACCSNRVAGLVLCSGQVKTAKLRDLGFPVVTYERFLNDADAGVECNNYEGGRLAAEELLRAGCRNLISVTGEGLVSMPADARRDGFLDACGMRSDVRARNFTCSPERIGDLDYIPELHSFLDEVPDADGVFAGSDVIAAQLIRVLRKRGKRVPEDVRIVGYDDVLVSELTDPQLTTVHQPVREMADACIDIVKKAAAGEGYPARTTLHVTLVRRGTT
ncbi:MAG: LacI family DNA-binding transcriptional regulator [Oscillospiraceae bacterium]|nr:LacI family DNA-binding transcriptional regulator [Oscillospiraceae bacterium]